MQLINNKELLDQFWELANTNEDKRTTAVSKLSEVLLNSQPKDSDHKVKSEELTYTLKRLVRGLSSDRKCARLGFAQALTQVLRQFKSVKAKAILKLCEKHHKLESQDSKKEKFNKLTGKVFVYLCLTRANRLRKCPEEELRSMVQNLVQIRKSKHSLHVISTKVLTEVIAQVSSERFRSAVLPELKGDLGAGWKNCTADVLWILLTARKHHKDVINSEFLKTSWQSKKLLHEKNVEALKTAILTSTDVKVQHPVLSCVVSELMDKDMFPQFWAKTFDAFIGQNTCRTILTLDAVTLALTMVTSVDQVKVILSATLLSHLLKASKKEKHLGTFVKALPRLIKNLPSGELQCAVVCQLITAPSSVHFDNITGIGAVANSIKQMSGDGATAMLGILENMILGFSQIGVNPTVKPDGQRKWAITQLSHLCGVRTADPQWNQHLLNFLFLHGFFEVKDSSSKIHKVPLQAFSVNIQEALRNAFFYAVGRVAASCADARVNQKAYIDLLICTVTHIETLMKDPLLECTRALTPVATEHWHKALQLTHKLNTRKLQNGVSSDKEVFGKKEAFQLLLTQCSLELWRDPQDIIQALDDIFICQQKALNTTNDSNADDPPWIEVITDLLVGLLSRSSHTLRAAVKTTMALLCSHVTLPCLQLIMDTIKAKPGEGDELMDFADDDTPSSLMSDPPESRAIADDEWQSDEGGDDSDSDDDDDDVAVDDAELEALKLEVKAALGEAAAASGDESEDLSDSEMERYNRALAQVFKKAKQGKQEEKQRYLQVLHLKLRCMDLIDEIVLHSNNAGVLTSLLYPLLELLEQTQKSPGEIELHTTAQTVYQRLCKRKVAFTSDDEPGLLELPALCRDLIALSTKVTGIPMVQKVGRALAFVLHTLPSSPTPQSNPAVDPVTPVTPDTPSTHKSRKRKRESGGAQLGLATKRRKVESGREIVQGEVIAVLENALKDFCYKRDSVQHTVFHEVLSRQHHCLTSLLQPLLTLATDPAVRIFCQTQMWSFMGLLITKNMLCSDWSMLAASILSAIYKVVEEQLELSSDNLRPKHVQVALTVLQKILNSDAAMQDRVDKSLSGHMTKIAERTKNKELKSLCNKLTQRLSKQPAS